MNMKVLGNSVGRGCMGGVGTHNRRGECRGYLSGGDRVSLGI